MANLIKKKSWEEFLADGDAFWHRTKLALKNKKVFIPEILYNIACMAIEKYFMAYLMYNHTMADNHTFYDLIESIKRIEDPGLELETKIKALDHYQEICSLSLYQRKIPSESDLDEIVDAVRLAEEFVKSRIVSD